MTEQTDGGVAQTAPGNSYIVSPDGVNKQAVVYVGIVVLLSLPFYWYVMHIGHMNLSVLGLMWCPGVAGIASTLIFRRSFGSLGWRWGGWGNIGLGFSIPLAYAAIAYSLIWGLGFGHVPNPNILARVAAMVNRPGAGTAELILWLALISGVFETFTLGLIGALGEEIGWRGFLVPTLNVKYGWVKTSLISGVIWSLWHWPLILAGPYHGSAPAIYSMSCFTVLVIAISFIFSWLRLRSDSVWPCALLHSSHNAWIQSFFTPLTIETPRTKWWIDEFGAMLAIVAVIWAAVLIWRVKRGGGIVVRG
jgi:membrane protease YdiL (CAAX protease family)